MKKILILLVAVFFLMGCASSTVSIVSKDGGTMTLKNYVFAEIVTYDVNGNITQFQKTMVPDKSIIEGSLDKIVAALKSLIGIAKVPAVTK